MGLTDGWANTPQGTLTWWDFCGGPVHTVPYSSTTQQTGPYNAELIGPSIAADGTIFQVVSSMTLDFRGSPCSDILSSVNMTLYLSQTAPDGSVTFTPFHTETSLIPDTDPFPRVVSPPQCPGCIAGVIPPFNQLPTDITFRVIPDGQGGALVPWWKDLGNYTTFEAHVTHVSAAGITDAVLPLTYQNTAILSNNVCPMQFGQLPCIADFRLVLGENGVAFATDLKSVVAFNIASMAPLWNYSSAAGMDLVAATADGGVTINDTQQGLVSLDATGNTSQDTAGPITPLASYSWTGQWYLSSASGSAVSAIGLPTWADDASLWATPAGNPSQTNSAAALCPCLTQSAAILASDFGPRRKRDWARTIERATPGIRLVSYSPWPLASAISSLKFANYSMRVPQSTGGNSRTYVLLVGDPGITYNVGRLFTLAADTQGSSLTASGSNTVITNRVSSVQDFNTSLTVNGNIDGGVFYFGHAAQGNNFTLSLLAPGQNAGVNTNISALNISLLSNAQLGSNSTITLRACHAGLRPLNGGGHSIAQLIANQLGRNVYAWKIGLFFSADPSARAPSQRYAKDPTKDPVYIQNHTMYLLPWGGFAPCTFVPNQPEPQHCGGER